jgi:hypothetical protein
VLILLLGCYIMVIVGNIADVVESREGTQQRSWLMHYATIRKVVGSIPGEVIGIFNWPYPSNRTITLGLAQPLTEMSTRNLPGGKGRQVHKADNLTAICEPIV